MSGNSDDKALKCIPIFVSITGYSRTHSSTLLQYNRNRTHPRTHSPRVLSASTDGKMQSVNLGDTQRYLDWYKEYYSIMSHHCSFFTKHNLITYSHSTHMMCENLGVDIIRQKYTTWSRNAKQKDVCQNTLEKKTPLLNAIVFESFENDNSIIILFHLQYESKNNRKIKVLIFVLFILF